MGSYPSAEVQSVYSTFSPDQVKYLVRIFETKQLCTIGGALGVMSIIDGNGHTDLSSIPNETVCISYGANALLKGTNPAILSPAK